MRTSLKLKHCLIALLLAAGLTACGGGTDDLDEYINEVKKARGDGPRPLPEVKIYEAFDYLADAEGLRSPFRPDTPQASGGGSGPRPDDDRSREYLESFPLDSLSMVGTMDIGNVSYGLVQAEGLIHRVIPGNYLGQNDGRITNISESEITVVEIISDGIGGYIERDAAVGLSD